MRTSIFTTLAVMFTVCTSSCLPVLTPFDGTDSPDEPPATTVVELEGEFRQADILLYDNSELRVLVAHSTVKSHRTAFELAPGDYTVVAIANLHGELVEDAIRRYESIETLCYRYCDEDPAAALTSATSLVSAGGCCRLLLQPLLCEVEILSIERDFAGAMAGFRAEDVRLYLANVNSKAEPLRQTGFRPSEMLNCGGFCQDDLDSMRFPSMLCTDLGCDIGHFALYPHISLFCYPNDSQEGIGTPSTRLVLDARVNGEPESWEWTLPEMSRGSKLSLSLVISDRSFKGTEMPR